MAGATAISGASKIEKNGDKNLNGSLNEGAGRGNPSARAPAAGL